jgi:hypothetical protein
MFSRAVGIELRAAADEALKLALADAMSKVRPDHNHQIVVHVQVLMNPDNFIEAKAAIGIKPLP